MYLPIVTMIQHWTAITTSYWIVTLYSYRTDSDIIVWIPEED